MIIDRLTTLLDFEIDRKALREYKSRMSAITDLTKRLAKSAKVYASDIKRGINGNSTAQQHFTNRIKASEVAIRKLEAASQGAHAKRRAANDKLIALERKKIALSKKLRDRLVRTAESHASLSRVVSRATDKENLKLMKTNAILLKQRAMWRKVGSTATHTLGKIAHRISRTASVLIRFRSLLGVSIAGVLGLRAVGSVVQSGFDVERTKLTLGAFNAPEGETTEQRDQRVAVDRKKIQKIALNTPFGLEAAEKTFLDLTRKGIDANKFTEGLINTAAKFGANKEQINRGLKQIADGFSKNQLTQKDYKDAIENKLPLDIALIKVLGDPNKSTLDNLGIVKAAIKNKEVGREVLVKVLEEFNKIGDSFKIEQGKQSFFQLDQLQDFIVIFKRTIAGSGFSDKIGEVIKNINTRLFEAFGDGSFEDAAKNISNFLVDSLESLVKWLEKTINKLRDGKFWFQQMAKAMGGYGKLVKAILSLGLAAWLSPVILLFAQLALVIRGTGFGFGKFAVLAYLAYVALGLILNHLGWIVDHKLAIVGAITAVGVAVLLFSKTVQKAIAGQLLWGAFSKGAAKGKVGILAFLGPLGQVAAAILILADNWDFVIDKIDTAREKMQEWGGFFKAIDDGLDFIFGGAGRLAAATVQGDFSQDLTTGKDDTAADKLVNWLIYGSTSKNNSSVPAVTVANTLKKSRTPNQAATTVTNNNSAEVKVMTTSQDTNGIAQGISNLLPEVFDQMDSGVKAF